ncbi:MAG: ferric reductase-like transmembrane domain-containing protein [Micropruina sp.]
MSMMGMQLVLVARIKTVAAPFGEDALVVFHRYMGYVGTVLVLAHPVILIAFVDPSYIERVIPWTAPWAGRFGTLAILCLVVVIVTSAWRLRLRISYERWQAIHLVASAVAIVAALTHVELIDYYINQPWKRVLWIAMTAAMMGIFLWVRIIRPLTRTRRPWIVESVVPQNGGICSITFRPVGHSGFTFAPGQFRMALGEPVALRADPASLLVLVERRRPGQPADEHQGPGGLQWDDRRHQAGHRGLCRWTPRCLHTRTGSPARASCSSPAAWGFRR